MTRLRLVVGAVGVLALVACGGGNPAQDGGSGARDGGSGARDGGSGARDGGSAATDGGSGNFDAGSATRDAGADAGSSGGIDAGSGSGRVDAGIDAAIDAGATCDPLAQTGCSAADKCAWIVDSLAPEVGHTGCVANGAVALGGACVNSNADGTGFDNCVRGAGCIGGVCEQICGPNGGAPTCDAAHACGLYDGYFGTPGSPSTAGLCDPSCDPLTQASGSAVACGSTTATTPDRGCYSGDFQKFACAGTPEGRSVAVPGTDRVACTSANGCANSSGQQFSNGCAPGFQPVLFDATGSSQVDCAALCAPLDTDSARPGNGPGDAAALGKLPGDAAPVAGHARCTAGGRAHDSNEECRYVSGLLGLTTGPFIDTLGVCFEPSKFMYDSNGDGTPDTVEPLCSTLKPGTPTTAGDPTFAVTFGCYKSTESLARTTRRAPLRLAASHGERRLPIATDGSWRRSGGVR